MHSRARAWYGRRTWHWRDWPAEALLEFKRRAELLLAAERRRPRPDGPVPGSPRLQQFVRDDGQVRPVTRSVPVRERLPLAVRMPGTQPGRGGGRQ